MAIYGKWGPKYLYDLKPLQYRDDNYFLVREAYKWDGPILASWSLLKRLEALQSQLLGFSRRIPAKKAHVSTAPFFCRGLNNLKTLRSHTPKLQYEVCTCNIPQNDVGSYSGLSTYRFKNLRYLLVYSRLLLCLLQAAPDT